MPVPALSELPEPGVNASVCAAVAAAGEGAAGVGDGAVAVDVLGVDFFALAFALGLAFCVVTSSGGSGTFASGGAASWACAPKPAALAAIAVAIPNETRPSGARSLFPCGETPTDLLRLDKTEAPQIRRTNTRSRRYALRHIRTDHGVVAQGANACASLPTR